MIWFKDIYLGLIVDAKCLIQSKILDKLRMFTLFFCLFPYSVFFCLNIFLFVIFFNVTCKKLVKNTHCTLHLALSPVTLHFLYTQHFKVKANLHNTNNLHTIVF